jgi:anaerobic magnesium-protoporphyrin IX monomethyl ester cyclase
LKREKNSRSLQREEKEPPEVRENVPNEGADFRTLLIFPPQWTPQNPHYAMASIAGHMRSKGHQVTMRDLNVEFYDEALTPLYIELSKQKILLNHNYLYPQCTLRAMIGDNSVEHRIEMLKLQEIERFLKNEKRVFESLGDLILDAKETFRDPRRFNNPIHLVNAFHVIDRALQLVSLPYYPARISFNHFEQPHCLFATHSLIVHAKDRSLNMFFDFYQAKISGLLGIRPSIIALSINSFSQVLPGLTLAHMLKNEAPLGTLISIGGNFFTRVKDTLLQRPEFFQNFCHVVALGEGEKQMVVMAETWREGKDLSGVPNIIYYKDGKAHFSYEEPPENLDNLGFQDYEGLPLARYFSPEPVICIQSSKGCYWGKCTFCDSDFGIHRDVKSLDRLIAEIRYLKEKYNFRHYEFIDESIKPDYMERMARRFIEEKLEIRWFSNGRLEDAFTPELLKLLNDAGLTMVLWGFESGCERIMKLINKGVNLEKRYDILASARDVGIWNFAYIFFGFPTETEEEAMETIRALCDHKDIIHSYGRSVFTLGRHSLLYLDAERYGIFDMAKSGEELSTNISYKSRSGMSDEKIDEIMKRCTKLCSEGYDFALWYYLRYRENFHLYITKHGIDYVKNFKVQEALSSAPDAW